MGISVPVFVIAAISTRLPGIIAVGAVRGSKKGARRPKSKPQMGPLP
jgi:hypothetical protein